MGRVDKAKTFVGDTEAKASEVNTVFDDIYNEFNGSVDEYNINFDRPELINALLTALKTVDGAGSGLDADTVDGDNLSDIQTKIDTAEADAKSYTDTAEADAKSYTDTHEGKITGVHGVGTSNVESVAGSQSKVNTHEGKITGVHGVGTSNVESVAGSQSKVNTHEGKSNPHSDSASDTEFTSHKNNTGNPHSVAASQLGATNILNEVKTVDGAGSGLDADTVDGKEYLDILKTVYPIGSQYINFTDGTNPGTLFGFGTWERIAEGRVVVGVDSTDTDFDTAEEIGGEKEHTLTDAEMPSHNHGGSTSTIGDHNHGDGANNILLKNDGNYTVSATADKNAPNLMYYGTIQPNGAHSHTISTSTAGSDSAHNNLQPYITAYIWKRTA